MAYQEQVSTSLKCPSGRWTSFRWNSCALKADATGANRQSLPAYFSRLSGSSFADPVSGSPQDGLSAVDGKRQSSESDDAVVGLWSNGSRCQADAIATNRNGLATNDDSCGFSTWADCVGRT